MTAPIETLLAQVAWQPTDNDPDPTNTIPYATHEGVLDLFDRKLRVYRLSDGQAIVNAGDLAEVLGMLGVGLGGGAE